MHEPRKPDIQALRVIKEPHNHQVVVDLPPGLSTAARVEVIVFAVDEPAAPLATVPRRQPHPALAGTTKILGDIYSAVDEADWNLLT